MARAVSRRTVNALLGATPLALGVASLVGFSPGGRAAAPPKAVISEEASAAVAQMGKTLSADQFSFQARTLRSYADSNGQPLHIAHSVKVTVRRPDRLLIEVMPPLLADPRTVPDLAPVERLSWGEWRAARAWPALLDRRWLESRLAPIHTWRFSLMSRLAPSFLPWAARLDYLWDGLDRCGAVRLSPDCARPEVRARGLLRAAGEYRELLAHYAIAPESDRALRQLLDECRREQIPVLLVLMPEGKTFRGWYPPAAGAAIDAYLAELRREYSVAVHDARTWIGELDFYDGHHLLPAGAAAFSRRLGVVARSFLLGEGDAAGPVR